MNLGILMVQGLVNSFGATVMAAFAAAVKIDAFASNCPQKRSKIIIQKRRGNPGINHRQIASHHSPDFRGNTQKNADAV